MSDGDFGKPPCTCTEGPEINGHKTWVIASGCPVHNPKK